MFPVVIRSVISSNESVAGASGELRAGRRLHGSTALGKTPCPVSAVAGESAPPTILHNRTATLPSPWTTGFAGPVDWAGSSSPTHAKIFSVADSRRPVSCRCGKRILGRVGTLSAAICPIRASSGLQPEEVSLAAISLGTSATTLMPAELTACSVARAAVQRPKQLTGVNRRDTPAPDVRSCGSPAPGRVAGAQRANRPETAATSVRPAQQPRPAGPANQARPALGSEGAAANPW